jgi:hypothetical protein
MDGDSSRKETSEQLTHLKFSFDHSARPQPQLLRQQQVLVYEGFLFLSAMYASWLLSYSVCFLGELTKQKGNGKFRNSEEGCTSSKSKFFLRLSTDEKINGCAREG